MKALTDWIPSLASELEVPAIVAHMWAQRAASTLGIDWAYHMNPEDVDKISATLKAWKGQSMKTVHVPRELDDRFIGLAHDGNLIIESNGMRIPLTACCNAAVTYHDTELCCKACWREVPWELDTIHPVVATPRSGLEVVWDD